MKKIDHQEMGFYSKEMFEFPNFVNVEVFSGRCPCRCVHCPVGITPPGARKVRFGERKISLDLFRKIVREVKGYPHATLRIHSVGEPLLWKGLPEALQYAKAQGARTWLFTSAVSRNSLLLEMVCRYTDIVEVSVNSINARDYSATKGVGAFERVMENIRHMASFIRRNELPTRLLASRVQSEDESADKDFVDFWKATGLVDDAFVRSFHTYNELLDGLSVNTPEEKTHQPCLVHWGRFNISAEGYAIVCFNELFKEKLAPSLIYGDVNNYSIAQIWKGEKMNALRRAELSGEHSALPFANSLPCRDCTSCQPLFGNRTTSESQIKTTVDV